MFLKSQFQTFFKKISYFHTKHSYIFPALINFHYGSKPPTSSRPMPKGPQVFGKDCTT